MTRPIKPCKRCGGKKLPGKGQRFCAECKPIAAEEQNEKLQEYKRTGVYSRGTGTKPAQIKNVVPARIRQAWSRAHPNSAMRKKFPTPQSLQKHNWEDEAAA